MGPRKGPAVPRRMARNFQAPEGHRETVDAPPSVPMSPRWKPGRRKILAIVVSVAVVIGAFVTWQFVHPRSIAEVLSMDHLAGGEISVQGTITSIGRENTSYGPRAYLRLDDNAFCGGTEPWTGNVLADPSGSYRVGDSYRTTLRLQAFSINGDSAVWAPELACPFPALQRSIGVVLDAISQVRNLVFAYNGSDANGWSRYELWAPVGSGYDPGVLPVVLLQALPSRGSEVRSIPRTSGSR